MNKNKKLLKPNELSDGTKKSMKARVITALVLVAICVPCLFLGGWFYFGLVAAVTGLCAYEIIHTARPMQRFRILVFAISFVIMYAFVFWIFIKNNLATYTASPELFDASKILTNGFTEINISTILVVVTAGFFFLLSFLDDRFTLNVVFYYFGMIVMIGICLQSVLYLRYSPFAVFGGVVDTTTPVFKYAQSAFLLIYVLIGVMFNDIGAYFVGVLFGKHKVNPRISPKKTWEGFVGGGFISLGLSLTWALVLAACGYPILPTLDIEHWYWVLLISTVMPILGDLGDFVFSAIKRHFAIKDFSNLLPGHGGVLDRLDSVLFTSGFVSALLILINNGWNFLK